MGPAIRLAISPATNLAIPSGFGTAHQRPRADREPGPSPLSVKFSVPPHVASLIKLEEFEHHTEAAQLVLGAAENARDARFVGRNAAVDPIVNFRSFLT
jgi:hypothetical protein